MRANLKKVYGRNNMIQKAGRFEAQAQEETTKRDASNTSKCIVSYGSWGQDSILDMIR